MRVSVELRGGSSAAILSRVKYIVMTISKFCAAVVSFVISSRKRVLCDYTLFDIQSAAMFCGTPGNCRKLGGAKYIDDGRETGSPASVITHCQLTQTKVLRIGNKFCGIPQGGGRAKKGKIFSHPFVARSYKEIHTHYS